MIAYIDSSVILRIVLPEGPPLREWPQLEGGVSSPLVAVECHRTLDRYWLQGRLDAEEVEAKRHQVATILRRLEPVPLDETALHRAAQPFPTIIATLDAIHLTSAILYRAAQPLDERPLLFATHDTQLARAARAMNFEVLGA